MCPLGPPSTLSCLLSSGEFSWVLGSNIIKIKLSNTGKLMILSYIRKNSVYFFSFSSNCCFCWQLWPMAEAADCTQASASAAIPRPLPCLVHQPMGGTNRHNCPWSKIRQNKGDSRGCSLMVLLFYPFHTQHLLELACAFDQSTLSTFDCWSNLSMTLPFRIFLKIFR